MNLPFLLCATVTLISAAVSLSYAVAAVRNANGEAKTLTLYAAARSAALVLAAALSFVVPQPGWLFAIATIMTFVQTADAYIGTTIKDRMKTLGPAFTAVANLATLIWALMG